MDVLAFRNVLQQLVKIHQDITELQRKGEQLAHAAGQAFEDFVKLAHPVSVPPNLATEHSL